MHAPWITYRPEIKVLDCTIRDGGLINDHQFDDAFVSAVYTTCIAAGIDYMELGYKADNKIFSPAKYGAWKFCREEDIRRIVGENPSPLKLSVMADAGDKCNWREDILPKDKSVLDLIRVACYAHQIPEAVEMIEDAHQKGYEVHCNIMAISTVQDAEIDQALEMLAQTPVTTVVVVDSYGSLYQEQIRLLVDKYRTALAGTGKEVGIHAHNNQQLAFANTIEAIIHGANRIDCTMGGMGRGAGNCCTELLLGFLRNPKFNIRPVWALLQEHIPGLLKKMEWGPYGAYIIGGQMNQHPREAMAWRDGAKPDACLDFYDKSISEV